MVRLLDLFPLYALEDTHDKLHIIGELGLIPLVVEHKLCYILAHPTLEWTHEEMLDLVHDLNQVEAIYLKAETDSTFAVLEALENAEEAILRAEAVLLLFG